MQKKKNQKHDIKIDYSKLHVNSSAMALAALLTVFHLQMEAPKHTKKHEQPVVTVNKTAEDLSGLFEREREIHPTHGSYGARAKLATAVGSS